VYEVTTEGEGPGGTPTRVSGVVALIPVGRGTVVLRAISTNARTTALAALRSFVPSIVGLDGSAPSWRVGLTGCPRPLTADSPDGVPPNGMRLAGVCTLESEGKSVEVLESRLPVRSAADARASGEFFRTVMERTVGRAGGRVSLEEPTPFTAGAVQGWYVVARASAETPEGRLQIERGIAVLPLDSGGHAELVVTVANAAAPTAVRSLIDALVPLVKLDGSRVTGPTGGPAAAVGDGGAPTTTPGGAPSRPPPPAFDPNAPIPTFPTEERPRVAQQPAQKSACGCTTPGAVSSAGAPWLAVAAALALSARRRKRA
jgi:MYXO-CTERM domain-containing protein